VVAEQARLEFSSVESRGRRPRLERRFGLKASSKGSSRAAFLKDLLSGKLNTPSAFQAHCGSASSISESSDGPILRYEDAALLVILPAKGAPRFQMLRVLTDAYGNRMTIPVDVDEEFALGRLHCTW
jgi:hypothetical protein